MSCVLFVYVTIVSFLVSCVCCIVARYTRRDWFPLKSRNLRHVFYIVHLIMTNASCVWYREMFGRERVGLIMLANGYEFVYLALVFFLEPPHISFSFLYSFFSRSLPHDCAATAAIELVRRTIHHRR